MALSVVALIICLASLANIIYYFEELNGLVCGSPADPLHGLPLQYNILFLGVKWPCLW